MTSSGGAHGGGTIFHINLDGTGFTSVYSFDTAQTGTGYYPSGDLLQASNGKLYGLTINGGLNSSGVLFSFDTTGNIYTDVCDLTSSICETNSLIQVGNGLLYGMCDVAPKPFGSGYIFSFDIISNIFTDLYDFDGQGLYGQYPSGALVYANNGLYYGTANEGGEDTVGVSVGVLFSFDTTTNTYTDLLNFDAQAPAYGWYPRSLIQASDGNLYGTCDIGASWNTLALYNSNTCTLLNASNDMTGPVGHPIQAGNGIIYGMTYGGGFYLVGGIYSYDPSNNNLNEMFDFIISNGANPGGSLIYANNGNLYGMTENGGADSAGVLFSYNIATNTYTDLLDFNGMNGKNPLGSLIILKDTVSNGIAQINNNKNQISINPNPATTIINIKNSGFTNYDLRIKDVLGREVYQQKIYNSTQSTIDISSLNNGVYIYQLNVEEETIRGKFVKE
jgi:uncharacterized repeat protein (TIGR03803 family)